MAGKVDVLAVMKSCSWALADDRRVAYSDQLRSAYAVVAELIEAAQVFDEKYAAGPDGELGIGLVNGDFFRLRAALARIGGAA